MKNDTVKKEYVYAIYGRMDDTCYTPDICLSFEKAVKLRREQIKEFCDENEIDLPDDFDSMDEIISVEDEGTYAEWNIESVQMEAEETLEEKIELFDADEICPHCSYGVIIMDRIARCPSCGKWIIACSMCNDQFNCSECVYQSAVNQLNEYETDSDIDDWFEPDLSRVSTANKGEQQ